MIYRFSRDRERQQLLSGKRPAAAPRELYALGDTLLEIVSVFLFALCCADCGFGWVFLKLFIMLVGVAMTVACAALSHLTRKTAQIKDENDLTI